MESLQKAAPLVGRILMALIFIMAGIGKFADPAMNSGYMAAMGVPTILLYPAALVEVIGGLLLIAGFQARWAALALAAFTLLASVLFHNNFADQMQMLMFMKNLAIIGGLLFVFAFGPGAYAVDKK